MNDLVEFYRARLDEDAQLAQEVKVRWWGGMELYDADESARAAFRAFVECFDEDRVLREVEAKRRILDAYEAQLAERARIGVLRDAEMAKGDELASEVAELTGKGIALNGWIQHLEWVVRVHVAAHADHPDYREEWRP